MAPSIILLFGSGYTLTALTANPLLALAWIVISHVYLIGIKEPHTLFGAFAGCVVATGFGRARKWSRQRDHEAISAFLESASLVLVTDVIPTLVMQSKFVPPSANWTVHTAQTIIGRILADYVFITNSEVVLIKWVFLLLPLHIMWWAGDIGMWTAISQAQWILFMGLGATLFTFYKP